MSAKDITDTVACEAVRDRGTSNAIEYLATRTGHPEKVCLRVLERLENRGLIECGANIRQPWMTDKGIELLTVTQKPCPTSNTNYSSYSSGTQDIVDRYRRFFGNVD